MQYYTSYVRLYVCDLFSYAHVNVNMYFETILFLKGSLSHWALADLGSAREIKVLICVGKTFRRKMCTYMHNYIMHSYITPYMNYQV